jgi:hypothetical protein
MIVSPLSWLAHQISTHNTGIWGTPHRRQELTGRARESPWCWGGAWQYCCRCLSSRQPSGGWDLNHVSERVSGHINPISVLHSRLLLAKNGGRHRVIGGRLRTGVRTFHCTRWFGIHAYAGGYGSCLATPQCSSDCLLTKGSPTVWDGRHPQERLHPRCKAVAITATLT